MLGFTTIVGLLAIAVSGEAQKPSFSNVETRNRRESAQFAYNLANASQKLGFSYGGGVLDWPFNPTYGLSLKS